MKACSILLILFLAACATKSETIYSQGVVVGWEQSGFVNTNGSMQISFETNNSNILVDKTTFAGIIIEDNAGQRNTKIGSQTFQVKLKVRAVQAEQFVSTSALLSLNGTTFEPIEVVLGADSASFGRHTRELDPEFAGQFHKISVRNDDYAHDWIVFEFDTAPPSPNESFSMEIIVKDNNSVSPLKVLFDPVKIKSYHSN